MLKNTMLSLVASLVLIWCGSSSNHKTNSSQESNTSTVVKKDNPTTITNLKITQSIKRAVTASMDFQVSYTVEDKDGLINSFIHVKDENGIDVKTKTFTFTKEQTKEDVNATFSLENIGEYKVAVEAMGVGSTSSSTQESNQSLKVVAQIPSDTKAPVLSSSDKTFTTTVGTPLSIENVTANDDVDGAVSVTKNGTVDFNTAGTYKITYSAKDSAGNSSSITHTYKVKAEVVVVTNQAPTANAGADKTITSGSTATLTCNGADTDGTISSYSWSSGETTQSITVSPTTTTTYTCTVTDDDGATATDSVKVVVSETSNTAPTLDVWADKTITSGDSVTLVATATDTDGTISSYSWSNGETTQSITVSPTTTTTYTCTVTDDDGATATDSVEVVVNPAPTWRIIADITEEDGAWRDFTRDFSGFIDNASGWIFSATKLPTGLTIDANSWVVTWYFDADPSEANRSGYSNIFSGIVITYTKDGRTYNSNSFTWEIEDEG